MAVQMLGIKTKFTDDQGRPLIGGSVHTYYAGTSLPQDTFSDPELTVPNTNPVKLDDTGSANIFLKGTYRVRVFDKNGVFVEEQDNVSQIFDSASAKILSDKLDVLPFEDGVLADTFVTKTINGEGQIERTQRDKNSDIVHSRDFVPSDLDSEADAAPYLQSATDYANGFSAVKMSGDGYNVRSDLLLKTGGLQGSMSGAHNNNSTLNLYAPLRQGRFSDDVNEKPTTIYGGWASDLKDISLRGRDPKIPNVINNEAHFVKYQNTSFRGTKDSGVPLLRLGGTLYTQIQGCDFGGTGEGDGIESKESTYDVAYYGTNASWFSRNNFNVRGTAAHLHGIYSFRDSTIENGNGSGKPRIIVGESGESTSALTIFDNVYFECGTSPEHITAPLYELHYL